MKMSPKPERYYIMSSSDDDDWTGEWMDELGWVGYRFGQLEWASFWLTEEIAPNHWNAIAELPFEKRCVYARKTIVPLMSDPRLRNEWRELFKEICRCAPMRNKIVHNPLEVSLHGIPAAKVTVDKGILLMRERGRRVLIGEVQAFREELMALHDRMIDLMKRTRGPE